MPKKILFLATSLETTGGIQQYARDFIRVAQGADYRVNVLAKEKEDRYLFAVHAGISIITKRPDVVLMGHIRFAPLAILCATLGIPYVLFVYGIEAWNVPAIGIWALKHARAVVAISGYTRSKVADRVPETARRITVISPTFDEKKFSPGSGTADLQAKFRAYNEKIILTVARLSADERYKGYDTVIEALPRVLEEVPSARYVIVGDGSDKGRIEELVRARGLSGKVFFAGNVATEDLPDYYRMCDVFVMPSRGEGFGIVFLEALGCGKSVVAGNADGSRDALQNGEVGLLVDPGSPEEIASAVVGILSKKAARDIMDGELLRRKTINRFGFEIFQKKVLNVLREASK